VARTAGRSRAYSAVYQPLRRIVDGMPLPPTTCSVGAWLPATGLGLSDAFRPLVRARWPAPARRRGDGVGVLPVAVGRVGAGDEHERVARAHRRPDGGGVVAVDPGGADPGVGEVGDGLGPAGPATSETAGTDTPTRCSVTDLAGDVLPGWLGTRFAIAPVALPAKAAAEWLTLLRSLSGVDSVACGMGTPAAW
jgi:hypothetical protein